MCNTGSCMVYLALGHDNYRHDNSNKEYIDKIVMFPTLPV